MRAPERSNTKHPRTGDEERQALEGAFARFGTVLMPADAPQPILDAPTRRALFEWMAELNATKDMAALGVKPRRRMLLDGPPGCGKTTLAHHIAGRQGVPLVTVEGSSINAPHVGESAANIAAVFQIARKQSTPVALFFDEFDAVARKRGDGNYSHAEAEGATIALLSQMDKHKGILFAATNQPERIDAAVQRRFEMRMTIELPGQDEREAIVRLYMKPLTADERIVEALADAMTGGSPAIIKEMCEAIKRGLVLGPRLNMDISFGALIRRAVTSVRPHEALAKPALWVNLAENIEALAEAADGHWPPEMPAAG